MKTVKSTIDDLGRGEVRAMLDLKPSQISKALKSKKHPHGQFPSGWWHGLHVLAQMKRKRYSKEYRLNPNLFAWRDYKARKLIGEHND